MIPAEQEVKAITNAIEILCTEPARFEESFSHAVGGDQVKKLLSDAQMDVRMFKIIPTTNEEKEGVIQSFRRTPLIGANGNRTTANTEKVMYNPIFLNQYQSTEINNDLLQRLLKESTMECDAIPPGHTVKNVADIDIISVIDENNSAMSELAKKANDFNLKLKQKNKASRKDDISSREEVMLAEDFNKNFGDHLRKKLILNAREKENYRKPDNPVDVKELPAAPTDIFKTRIPCMEFDGSAQCLVTIPAVESSSSLPQ